MIKIRIPATSANLGAGFDALGLAMNYYNYVQMEESDHIEISSVDDTPIPVSEITLRNLWQEVKRTENYPGKQYSHDKRTRKQFGVYYSGACRSKYSYGKSVFA